MWTDLDLTGTRWIAPSSTSSSNIWTESECYSFFNRIPTATAVGPLNLSIPSRLRNHFLSVPLLTSLRFSLPRQGSVLWRIVPWLHLSQILAVNPSMPASPSLSIFWFTVSLSLFIHSLSLSLSLFDRWALDQVNNRRKEVCWSQRERSQRHQLTVHFVCSPSLFSFCLSSPFLWYFMRSHPHPVCSSSIYRSSCPSLSPCLFSTVHVLFFK